jgi:ribose transport system ATP-binding protein
MSFRVENLVKSYSGVPVLNGVDLAVDNGEIHALLGANGAGKSTLIKCISGATAPNSGTIVIAGRSFSALTPKESRRAGIAVIYQELSVASSLSVLDNIFLSDEIRFGPLVKAREQRAEARRWLTRMDLDLDLDTPLSSLGNADAQAIEILKALRASPNILILDEPTASLTDAEARQLAVQMRALKAHGVPLLYVTHRLGEVFDLADSVSILRGGEVVLSGPVKNFGRDDLVGAIVGPLAARRLNPQSVGGASGQATVMFRARSLLADGIGPIDLEVRKGEVLGLFGLVGSGRTELLETLFGARRLHAGTIELEERRLSLGTPSDAVAEGIALVPSDRARNGLFGSLRADENVMLPIIGRLARAGFRRRQAEKKAFAKVTDSLQLRPRRPDMEARRFSGGNQQKLVLGRWLQPQAGCRVLLLDEPTQGVDVGGRGDLYQALRHFADAGQCAILASGEPDELQQVVDRVVILSRGRIAGVLHRDEISERRLVEMAHLAE